ncbi:site-specific integrase [Carbonactinospora thermoautotrophica]|uniref:tyrosine-type recombinase/integrase n=1 Tax=Carbonactinospora thermoautotrophica TaxID=1469144 RepID=UPI0022711FB3|nr:tyrosine-type recombinase/integrase [Carbonactinospora thermoautotrophica]MCX9191962.1 site-specific integrase [Carbonactinospora thermoautotrophica]
MPTSYDVRFLDVKKVKDRPRRPWRLRWFVAGQPKSKMFATKALADNHKAKLMRAAQKGEAFDVETGEPVSWHKHAQRVTWYEHAVKYVEMKWPRVAAKSRRSIADTLATVTPALVKHTRGQPDSKLLRRALYGWAFNPKARQESEPPKEVAQALAWISKASVALVDLNERETVRKALDTLALRLDGKPAGANTVKRKRAVFYNVLEYAVELDRLDSNPIERVKWRAPAALEVVDRRVVVNPKQARALLDAVRAEAPAQLAFFGCLYYGALRPAEAVNLWLADCHLPEQGWGELLLSGSLPHSGAAWTDTGEGREERGLKHRPRKGTRPVPIPPRLVALLREHIDTFGVTPDGRLFRGARGGPLSESVYGETWRKAREKALTPDQQASPMARRPYDLRHAAVSTWLNAGVPATEVAKRAGHSVNVLLKVYAKCLDGQAEIATGGSKRF